MNKVIEIKRLRNNTYLVVVSHDQKESTHVLTEEAIIKYNLLEPKEISDKEYDKLKAFNEESLLYQKALTFIDYQMRSVSETKKHLRKTVQDEEVIQKVINKLKQQGYLNDNHYVSEYINEKMNFDNMGPKLIKEKLIQKGVHYDVIDAHLVKYETDLQFDKVKNIIDNETKYPIKKPFKKAYMSIKTKLVNKGFSLDVIESSMISYSDIIRESCLEVELLEREIVKLKNEYDVTNYQEKDKVVKKLMQKGFDYELIKKHL